jgi:hypothetical protein
MLQVMLTFFTKPENLNNAAMNLPASRQEHGRVEKLVRLHLINTIL